MATNCFRYFNFTSFSEVDRLTIPEYKIMIHALELRQIDEDYRQHMQSYLNFKVQATKKSGKDKVKPVYKSFKSFFDYEAAQKRVLKQETKPDSVLSRFLRGKK